MKILTEMSYDDYDEHQARFLKAMDDAEAQFEKEEKEKETSSDIQSKISREMKSDKKYVNSDDFKQDIQNLFLAWGNKK